MRRSSSPRQGAGGRVRRIIALAAAIALVPCLFSLGRALSSRSDSSTGILTVEWLRDNGARGIVAWAENLYYSWNAPDKGGPGLKALPQQPGTEVGVPRSTRAQGGGRGGVASVALAYRPPAIAPVLHPALPGEGVWRATWAHGGAHPPVLVTSFRPEPDYPRVVAGVAWIDQTRTSTMLYPGIREPAVPMSSRGPEEVPPEMRPRLVATFNSAFKLTDSRGGFADGGRTYAPLAPGEGTFVRYRNGRVDIVAWSGGSTAGPDVLYARQNLPLIVEGGRPNPNLSDGPKWGYTLGNAVMVWRSGVGIDRRGNLIYAAAPDQTVGSLAGILIRAGAVRAMELDINSYWPSFITYRYPGAASAANLLPGMVRSPERYLTPDDRDFFAVYLR